MNLKLAIDPGHGRGNRRFGVYDPGAVSANGTEEADIALQWALTLKWVCAQEGIPTFLTRDDDQDDDPLSTRDDRAELAGCTHFISLHCNAANSYNPKGYEAYYRDNKDKLLAAMAHDAMDAIPTKMKSRGIKHETESAHKSLAIFGFDGPACLLEIGFMSRPSDVAIMLRRESRIAWARAFVALLKKDA